MSAYAERQRGEMLAYLDHLDAIVKLAGANFPRNTDLKIETTGTSPYVSMSIPSWAVSMLLRSARVEIEA